MKQAYTCASIIAHIYRTYSKIYIKIEKMNPFSPFCPKQEIAAQFGAAISSHISASKLVLHDVDRLQELHVLCAVRLRLDTDVRLNARAIDTSARRRVILGNRELQCIVIVER